MIAVPDFKMVWIHSSIVDYEPLLDRLDRQIEEPDSEMTTDVMEDAQLDEH